ncbi:MAG: flagellar basal body rod protein FlgB [Caulobacteraceae bacterium]|nr:flagellar basal body protein [Caulobacter sp.]RYF92395.1 MAG: flagellar basal body rod protein FlgB [Caulobacteraceae bacterium]
MNITDIPLFSMLRSRLGYLSDRQNVIAENIANANTPDFVARDVKPFSFDAHMKSGAGGAGAGGQMALAGPVMTKPNHLAGTPRRTTHDQAFGKAVKSRDSETTLDGNGVVLEDQMMKMTETRMQYDAAIGFYQKSMALLRMAARPPGR